MASVAQALATAMDLAYYLNGFDTDHGTKTDFAGVDYNQVTTTICKLVHFCTDDELLEALNLMQSGYEDCARELLEDSLGINIMWEWSTRQYRVDRAF